MAVEESVYDSDLGVVKRTRPKSKSGVSWFRKKPKDESTEKPIDEEGSEGLTTSAATMTAPPSRENLALAEGALTGIEESSKEGGTSPATQVRTRENVPRLGF